ncbi:EsaB/YukD family protein [Nesterenkonia suensis]
MSTGYTRVTVATAHRNIEMLLPSQREIDTLMPEILHVAADGATGESPQALTLTPAGGSSLLGHQTLQDVGIGDGSVLRLDRRDEAVPTPLVYDLAEETEQLSPRVTDSWTIHPHRLVSAAVFTVLMLAGLQTLTDAVEPAAPGGWALTLSAGALVALASVPRRLLAWDAEFLTLSAAALALAHHWGLPEIPHAEWTVPAWLAAALLSWQICLHGWLAAGITTGTTAALAGLWWGGGELLEDTGRVAAVAGIGTVVLLGFAPRLALMLSGMNRLDDAIGEGARPHLGQAEAAFHNAHRGLAAAVVLCGVSAAVAAHGLLSGGLTAWTLPLAAVLTLLTALRSRSMPLAVERAALLTSAAVSTLLILHSIADHAPTWLLISAAVLLALTPLVLRLTGLPDHVAARLRLTARRFEVLATISLIPLLLGLFGLYAQLTSTFQD